MPIVRKDTGGVADKNAAMRSKDGSDINCLNHWRRLLCHKQALQRIEDTISPLGNLKESSGPPRAGNETTAVCGRVTCLAKES